MPPGSNPSGGTPLVDGVDAGDLGNDVTVAEVTREVLGEALDPPLAKVHHVRFRSH